MKWLIAFLLSILWLLLPPPKPPVCEYCQTRSPEFYSTVWLCEGCDLHLVPPRR